MAQIQRAIKPVGDKILHTIQLFFILATAIMLIIFAHQWLPPEEVFVGMVAGLAGIVGSRIASNGYTQHPP